MPSDPRIQLVDRFFSGTGPSYDQIVKLFTLGIDRLWKKRIIQELSLQELSLQELSRPRELTSTQKLPATTRVLDLACGTGILTFAIAQRFPHYQVVGVELREEYLEIAKQKALRLGLNNVKFILSRAEDLQLDERFDWVTSSYLAKYADLKCLLPNLSGMMKGGAKILFHDFTYPSQSVLAAGWELYFKLLQRFGSRWYPEWKNIFYGLPELMRQTQWVQEIGPLLGEFGFQNIRTEYLTLGASALVTATKPHLSAKSAG